MATNSSVSLKLFIDTRSRKVLFAEAEKDFVDFLFNLMALPVGTVTRLLTKDSMVDSLGNLYDSIETMNNKYLVKPQEMKEALLMPKFSSSLRSQVRLLPDYASVPRKFYSCANNNKNYSHHNFVADDSSSTCPFYGCGSKLSRELVYVTKPKPQVVTSGNDVDDCDLCECEDGFVKRIATYVVMDDLVVKPMSSFTMFKSFNFKDISELEEKVVHLDLAEASLQSKKVLTSVFLESNDNADTKATGV